MDLTKLLKTGNASRLVGNSEIHFQPVSLIGTNIGEYEIISLVGPGGMSAVYLAKN